ncbi:uncharacterized protein LOC6578144 [Drosophila mojavensis]|uniref:Uncharacterized protein n=1 Tax=Drosophila mojavensis TaxID=7230 RepID=B4KIZ0_DROMO|nr:uncharacterized protein LOC6578144 [Drosophila mojavensis]EDW13503.2 uncharacterized protein Dmoj_GI19675 [Drosophila mojavensis]
MFRNLCMLRKNILVSRIIYSTYNYPIRANLITYSRLRSKAAESANRNGVSVSDINVYDMAKGDVEFARNFLTSAPSLNNGSFSAVSIATSAFSPEPAVGAGSNIEIEIEPVSESPDSGIGSANTTILDKDGLPIVPIEIDGWKSSEDDDEGPTVQSVSQHIEIGNDSEYKADNMLVVPEKREGSFEYKGIKVKLPETAHKDIGTYRFRRDPEDLETVADDMRLVKFDKK